MSAFGDDGTRMSIHLKIMHSTSSSSTYYSSSSSSSSSPSPSLVLTKVTIKDSESHLHLSGELAQEPIARGQVVEEAGASEHIAREQAGT